jgi:BlaI family transcriptional regulator, penicillinase repressor
MSKKPAPARLTEAEWSVMQVVWRTRPTTARDVVDALATEQGWAYTTVKTLLTRLAAKGVLREEMRGNQAVYEPLVAEDEARRSAVRTLADRAFGGSLIPMARFLLDDEELSSSERRQLRELLDQHERRKRR